MPNAITNYKTEILNLFRAQMTELSPDLELPSNDVMTLSDLTAIENDETHNTSVKLTVATEDGDVDYTVNYARLDLTRLTSIRGNSTEVTQAKFDAINSTHDVLTELTTLLGVPVTAEDVADELATGNGVTAHTITLKAVSTSLGLVGETIYTITAPEVVEEPESP